VGHSERVTSDGVSDEGAGDQDTGAPPAAAIDNSKDHLRPSAVGLTLFAQLEREGIRYCHWKSNIRLGETLGGLQDIDLLVHPEDAHAFQRIINECGFKLTVSRMGTGHPGVFHAVAWDQDSGRLLDLHAYHQLVSGDSYVKSYRFAVEEEFLSRTSSWMGVRIPEPAAELVLFVLRMLLKHSSMVEIRKVNGHYGECRDELSWLLQRSDVGEAAALCDDWFPSVRIPFQQMIDCVATGTVLSRVALGMRVAWALRDQRRIGHVAAGLSRMVRFGSKYASRLRSRRNLSLLAGGAWIALVGPKGTGKSTLSNLLAKRLGAKLDVKQSHFGKPPATWLSFLPRLIASAARKAPSDERRLDDEDSERRVERQYSTKFVVSKLLVAFDRRQLLKRIMRDVSAGTIVISDRCPVTNATGMDGSAFDDLALTRARSPFQRWLMERERAIYRCLPRPRLVVKLSVPIETALKRDLARSKPEGPLPNAIKRRWALESESEFARSTVCLFDTDRELDETFRAIAARVWQSI
jgi:thymidylate kinase